MREHRRWRAVKGYEEMAQKKGPAGDTASKVTSSPHITKNAKALSAKRRTTRERNKQEIKRARRALEAASSSLAYPPFDIRALETAFTCAVIAWCCTHLRDASGDATDIFSAFAAFDEKAPHALKQRESEIRAVFYQLSRGKRAPAEAYLQVETAINEILEVASHPPRSRRRFPARYRANRPIKMPRVKPGGWIDTGRYRPAQVLTIMDHPPHIMTLSYGDETDDDFRPHVTEWRTIRMRRRPPSLKDVFSAEEWIRHLRFGYGRVRAVRDTTMDVAFDHRERTLIPDAALTSIEKIDEPEPADDRPFAEQFPPGSFYGCEGSRKGVIITVKNERVTVLDSGGITTWVLTKDSFVFWKVDRPPLDLSTPREKRRIWWWSWRQHSNHFFGRPCPCCGYPNFGIGTDIDDWDAQCVVCGWYDQWDDEENADEIVPVPNPENPYDWEWSNWGYSLTEARRNFAAHGLMFRRGDPRAAPFAMTVLSRGRLVRELDRLMATGSAPSRDEWAAVEQSARLIRLKQEKNRPVWRKLAWD